MSTSLINTLRDRREALSQEISARIAADTEGPEIREQSETEAAELRSKQRQLEILDERIAELQAAEGRAASARLEAARFVPNSTDDKGRIVVGSEPATYRKGGPASYFADLARATMLHDGTAAERLRRHEAEVRDLDRTDGTGGYFVPPKWLVEDFVALNRAGRVTANLVSNQALPAGTDSINIPKISTGTSVAAQTADNAAVSETDLADTSISAGVKTLAGQQDVALQVVEQSPIAFDQMVFGDLTAELAKQVDVQVINGSDASGQVEGILQADGIISVTYTDATPTVAELYPKLADAIQQIHTNRFMPPTAIVMHPRRWGWLLAALDGSSRPFITPYAPQNALGATGPVASEGPVGTMHGLPVYVDANIPINLGAGTNEDRIIVGRMSDAWLFEGGLRSRVLPDVLSGNLTVRFQVYKYIAFTAERQPKSFAVISGTGLITPTF